MNFEEFKKAFDFLAEKFGMAVDWTADNVLPYVKEVGVRVAKYIITEKSIGVAISLFFIVLTTILFVKIAQEYAKAINKDKSFKGLFYTHNKYSEDPEIRDGTIVILVIGVVIAVSAAICFFICLSSLLKWIFIPELAILEYLKTII